jgi:hypothetical protein
VLQIVVYASPILLFSFCCSHTIGPAIRTVPEAKRSETNKIRENFLLALCIRSTSPIIFQLSISEYSVTGNVWSAASRKIREFSPQCRCSERSPTSPISAVCHAAPNFSFCLTLPVLGEFDNKRRSAANRRQRLGYSLASLLLRQYYWACNSA